MLKKMCHWGWALRVPETTSFTLSSLYLMVSVSTRKPSVTVPAPCLPIYSPTLTMILLGSISETANNVSWLDHGVLLRR